ncbi:hypothetical protein [Pseudooceanicola nitratireducens]|uniref:hypothetical protein n=1 Tax=Pseudooceanicola nitratireducens TaxID=517719 RepID=UPI003C7A3580
MNVYKPHMATKVRSNRIMQAPAIYRQFHGVYMPCTPRIASFLGLTCADHSTVVMAHGDGPTKGMSTKTSDIDCMAACSVCHRLIDEPSPQEAAQIHRIRAAYSERLRQAGNETRAILIDLEIIIVPDAELI